MAESLMNKERYRWSYMTENQLTTRLNRITNPEKLRCFIELSFENNNRLLNHLAVERLKQIDPFCSLPEPIPGSLCVRESEQRIVKWKAKKAKKAKEAEDNIRKILI